MTYVPMEEWMKFPPCPRCGLRSTLEPKTDGFRGVDYLFCHNCTYGQEVASKKKQLPLETKLSQEALASMLTIEGAMAIQRDFDKLMREMGDPPGRLRIRI